jgi:hypothetical protein
MTRLRIALSQFLKQPVGRYKMAECLSPLPRYKSPALLANGTCRSCPHLQMPSLKQLLALSADEGWGLFPITPGQTLNNGRYRIIRLLGYGQYSTVALAADLSCARLPRNDCASNLLKRIHLIVAMGVRVFMLSKFLARTRLHSISAAPLTS